MLANAGNITTAAALEIQSNVTGSGYEIASNNGSIKFDGAVAAGNNVVLGGTASAGTLELAAPGSFRGTIESFIGPGNQIIRDNVPLAGTSFGWTQVNASIGKLVVESYGNIVVTLTIQAGSAPAVDFTSDPMVNGWVITAPAATTPLTETGPGLSLGQLVNGNNIMSASPGTLTLATTAGTAVTLYDGATAIGTATANAGGVVSFDASGLGLGSHVLSAAAGGTLVSSAVTLVVAASTQTPFVLNGATGKLVGGNNADVVNVGTGSNNIYLGNGYNSITARDGAV